MLPWAALRFPETKGLSLEEIGALFNDEVVLDISHLSEEKREALDTRIAVNTDSAAIAHIDFDKDSGTEKKEFNGDVET